MKTLKHLCIIISFALGILIIPNLSLFDEELLPEITQHLASLPSPDIVGNAAPLMFGLWATSERDIKTTGEQAIATLRSKHARGEFAHLTPEENQTLFGNPSPGDRDKAWLALYPSATCNPREQSDCFAKLIAELKAHPINDERLLVQLTRYNRAIQQPHFVEDNRGMDTTSPVPNYGYILHLGRIQSANSYLHNGIDGLITASEADMKFWRMALKESQVLIGKMIAVSALRKNIDNLSYAITQETDISNAQLEKLTALAQPLQKDEINIDIFASEYRSMIEDKHFFEFMGDKSTLFNRTLLLLNQHYATTNWFYQQTIAPTQKLTQMSSPDFYMAAQNPIKPLPFSRINPYNLGGKIAMSNSWQMTDYIGRIRDLDGLYSLLNLQLELRKTSADITETINKSHFKNPYTEKPFDYSSANRQLSFRCFNVRDVCRINL